MKKYLFYSLFLSLAMGYTVYGIRYMLGFISLSYPVLSLSYFKKQNIIKIIIVIYAIFYMVHTSMYSTLRPYSYLKAVQDRIRNLDYKFMAPTLYSEYTAYKKSAQNYCKNGNKIGIISGVSNVLYGAKYLELENDCKIDTIVLLHANKDTLLNYDAIILEEGGYQNTVSTTKEDIKNDTVTSDIIACKKGVIIKGNIPYNYICRVNEKLLSFEGYKKRSEYIYIDKDNDNFVSHKLITRAKI